MNLCSIDKVDNRIRIPIFHLLHDIHNLTFICNNKISNLFVVKLFTLEQFVYLLPISSYIIMQQNLLKVLIFCMLSVNMCELFEHDVDSFPKWLTWQISWQCASSKTSCLSSSSSSPCLVSNLLWRKLLIPWNASSNVFGKLLCIVHSISAFAFFGVFSRHC